MNKILFKHQLEFTDKEYVREILYDSDTSSDRFELRLFFTQLLLDKLESKDEIDQIRKLLNGFEYRLYDLSNNAMIAEYKFEINNKETRYHTNYNQPFSLWLMSSIKIKSGNVYKIILKFPSTYNTDEKFTMPMLVGGISKDIIL